MSVPKMSVPESLQMENRDLRWIGLGLGSPKTLFSARKPWFLGHFWPFPIIWGFPLGGVSTVFIFVAHAVFQNTEHHADQTKRYNGHAALEPPEVRYQE